LFRGGFSTFCNKAAVEAYFPADSYCCARFSIAVGFLHPPKENTTENMRVLERRNTVDLVSAYLDTVATNWPIWFVTITLIVAAVIDGFELKVPNWITFPMVISGWIYSAVFAHLHLGLAWYEGLGWSLAGTIVGLLTLLPLYSIGGMGAGDVKLMAGIGAWVHVTHTLWAFAISGVTGAVLAVLMVLYRRAWSKHSGQFLMIFNEIMTIKDPEQLSAIAADRKSSMLLLPYGIPIAMGTIAYFAWTNMLV
jgi:prepilin peptidase CpaA